MYEDEGGTQPQMPMGSQASYNNPLENNYFWRL